MTARPRVALVCGALALGALHAAACTSGAGEPAVARSVAAIQGGAADTTHRNVVAIVRSTGAGVALCTGSLIAPNLVLTARHCVSDLSGREFACQTFTDTMGVTHTVTTARAPAVAADFDVTTDAVVGETSTFTRVAEVLVPPNSTNVPICGKDIAMLRLIAPITGVGLVVPRLDLTPTPMETFTAVGYGGTDGAGRNSGERRYRGGLSVQFVGQAFARDGTTNVQILAMEELIADTGTCEGDSGGPAFDALGQTFGILSRGDATSCDGPIYTRVDAYGAWIRAQALAAASAAGDAPQPWVTPPVSGSANQGDDCVSDDQCAIPLVCLVLGDRRRCTTTDCSACDPGWVCGTANAMPACVPDPSLVQPDSDAGAEGGAPDDGGGTPAMDGGCSVHARGGRTARGGLWILALAIAIVCDRRRRAS